jgi:hypothetical protein
VVPKGPLHLDDRQLAAAILLSSTEHKLLQGWVMLQAPLTVGALLVSQIEQGRDEWMYTDFAYDHLCEQKVNAHVMHRVTASVTAGV